MRIVEPKHLNPQRPRKNNSHAKFIFLALFVLFAVSAATIYLSANNNANNQVLSSETPTTEQLQNPPQNIPPPDETPLQEPQKVGLRQFSDNEFKLLFDNLRMPNQDPLENPPQITGNDAADIRIRALAETRGYRLRSLPASVLPTVDGEQLQESVIADWQALKKAAQEAGHTMTLVSGYRSVESQRSLFTQRLSATGTTAEMVANGLADDKVDFVLKTSSIPGYSKHHTGYTIDLQCAGYAFENFKDSPCHVWLQENNFEKSKTYGFIPSYPVGAGRQGPDPEAWEYVWVGKDLLTY